MIEIHTRNFDLHITVPSPNLAFLCRNLDYKPYSIKKSIKSSIYPTNKLNIKKKKNIQDIPARTYDISCTNGFICKYIILLYCYISDPPQLEARPDYIHTGPGGAAEMECQVRAGPHADVEWHFNGAPFDTQHAQRHIIQVNTCESCVIHRLHWNYTTAEKVFQ